MTQHTPGPWKESPHDPVTLYGDIDNAILAPDGMRLASVYGGKELQPALPLPTFAEARANARLIAAAPTMYEALVKIAACDQLDYWPATIAREALALMSPQQEGAER